VADHVREMIAKAPLGPVVRRTSIGSVAIVRRMDAPRALAGRLRRAQASFSREGRGGRADYPDTPQFGSRGAAFLLHPRKHPALADFELPHLEAFSVSPTVPDAVCRRRRRLPLAWFQREFLANLQCFEAIVHGSRSPGA
jgi:hypothetical protein